MIAGAVLQASTLDYTTCFDSRSITRCHSAVKKSRGNESVPSVPASRVKQQTAVASSSLLLPVICAIDAKRRREENAIYLPDSCVISVYANNVIFLYENESLIYSIMITSTMLVLTYPLTNPRIDFSCARGKIA